MKWLTLKLTQSSLKAEWPQICLLLALAMAFTGNVLGLVEFGGGSLLGIQLNFGIFSTASGSFTLPSIASTTEFFALFSSSVLLAIVLPVLKPIPASGLVLLLTITPIYMGINLPYSDNIIPMQYTLLVLLMLFGMNILLNYFTETKKKQNLLNVFGRFMPPEIVEQLSKNPDLFDLDGDLRNMTVFFSDLRNFTAVSEKLNPKQLVSLLNEYFTIMTAILYKHGATIDKYIGDSIMAFWSAPLPQEDHARRSLMAAFEMHEAIDKLSADYIARGWPGPTMGVGINSGMMNVGNMGSKYRLAYTVIGDAVNLSSRLQTLTRKYQVPTIVGESTVRGVDDIAFRELDTVTVRGKHELTRIYQPICLKSELSDSLKNQLDAHQKALEYYYANDYVSASQAFITLLNETDQDQYYQFMLDNIARKETNSD